MAENRGGVKTPTLFDVNYVSKNEYISKNCILNLFLSGPVGMAAAAAIASAKKRKRPHSFETNPSIRRRQQTRLLRKLRVIIFRMIF